MSDNVQVREQDPTLGGAAVDQGARAARGDADDQRVPSSDEVVETLRQQLADLESRDAESQRRIEEEKERAAAADRARAAAEARARDADTARQSAEQAGQRSLDEANLDAVKSALATHEGHLETLAARKAALQAEGNFDEAAKLDAQMAKIGGRIAQLEDGKTELEQRIKNPPERPAAAQPSMDERREQFIRSQPPRVQDWLRGPNGQRFFTDQPFQERVAAAAKFAQSVKGIPIDSADYITYIEEQVGLRQPSQEPPEQPSNGARPAPRGREADTDRRMVTAPAGGATGGSVRANADGSTNVYLTRDEKDMAARMGVSEAEYARNKRDLIAEGLIGPGARNR